MKRKRLLMLGLDAALPDLIRKFTDEGVMPNTKRLMERGFFSRMITTFPPLTAAAWGAITTGAGPGTAGIPSLMVHEPGEPLDRWHTSFDRRLLKAETLWEAAAREGKKTLLVNWPVTWPLGIDIGIQLSASLNPPFRFFYMPLWDIASSSVFSTKRERCNQVPGRAVVVSPKPAGGWKNAPAGEAFEFAIEVPPVYARGLTYQVLLIPGEKRIIVAPEKDCAKAVADLTFGDAARERSPWIVEHFTDSKGEKRIGRFYFYFPHFAGVEDFRLYQSAVNTAESLTVPPEITEELTAAAGPYMEVDDPWAYMDGWVSLGFYLKQLEAHNTWWEKATRYGLKKLDDWDMAFSWVGTIDHVQHVLHGGIDPKASYYDPKAAPKIMAAIRGVYADVDRAIGKILEGVDLDETLICVVSDHGFSTIEQNPYLKHHLAQHGLLSFALNERGEMRIDWTKTKAFPLEPCHAHIFVNLKGRDPDGIVDPADYGKVQDEIIDCLQAMRDPVTGERVVVLAVRKEEAGTLGVQESSGFPRMGDVLFALRPQYMANPFVYPVGVKYRDGTERFIPNPEGYEPAVLHRNFTGVHLSLPHVHEMHAAVIMAGEGVPRMERAIPMDVTDLAPTLARLTGNLIPKDAEGNVLKEVL